MKLTGTVLAAACVAALTASTQATSATVSIITNHTHASVDEQFASFTIDGVSVRTNFQDPKLRDIGKSWTSQAPSYLRVGGTFADYVIYAVPGKDHGGCPMPLSTRCYLLNTTQWSDLLEYAHYTGLHLVFGLNDLAGRIPKGSPEKPEPANLSWNSTNARDLLEWTAANIPADNWPFAFELGNELNDMLNGSRQANDVIELSEILAQVFPDNSTRPKIVAPDPHSSVPFSTSGLEWVHDFATTIKKMNRPIIHAFSFHMYSLGSGEDLHGPSKFYDPSQLDRAGQGVKAVRDTIYKVFGIKQMDVWLGESAAANGGGKSGLTNTYVDSFWYLDQLGASSAAGIRAFCRQSLLGSSYGLLDPSNNFNPRPDFYVGILWKKLMGAEVLQTYSSSRSVRAYTNCNPEHDGGATVAIINLGDSEASVTIDLLGGVRHMDLTTAGTSLYSLTAPNGNQTSNEIELNGQILRYVASLPPLIGVNSPGLTLDIPGKSYGFARVTGVTIPACSATSSQDSEEQSR